MKTHLFPLAPLAAGLLLAFNAAAQDHSHNQTPMLATSQERAQDQMPAPTQDHSQQQPPKPKAKPKPKKPKSKAAEPRSATAMDQAAMGHVTQEAKPVLIDHAAMGHDTPESKSAEAIDHAAMGHENITPAGAMNHAAMGHAMPRSSNKPTDQPITPIPVLTDADRAAAMSRPNGLPAHDNTVQNFMLFNRLEAFDADGGIGQKWEGQAWFGTDLNRLWLRSEGERIAGHTEAADLEVLYGRAFARWWDVVTGVRHDFKPGASQDFAAIGVVGLAPYKFEVEATGYIGQSGQTAARLEAEYETLLTNRLILQPLAELNFYGKNDERRGIGSGLSTAEAGLRLRYEITRKLAPYVGVVHEWTFGNTANFRRNGGEESNDTRIVAGVRIWF